MQPEPNGYESRAPSVEVGVAVVVVPHAGRILLMSLCRHRCRRGRGRGRGRGHGRGRGRGRGCGRGHRRRRRRRRRRHHVLSCRYILREAVV